MNWRRRKPRKRVDSRSTARERCDSSSQQLAWPRIFFLIFHLPITQFLDMSQVQWKMSTAETYLSFFLILPVSLLITVSNKKKLFAFESRLCCSKAWWPLVANVCSHMTVKFYFFMQIICWAPRLHRFSFPSVFFIAQLCELLYSSHDHSECPVGIVTFCLQLKWLWIFLEELFVMANQLGKMQGHWMIFWSEVEIYKWLPDIYKRLGFLVFSDKEDKS